MAQTASILTKKVYLLLVSDSGLPAAVSIIADLAGVQLPPFAASHVISQNVAPEIVERSNVTRYPAIHIYCNKVMNELREKSRVFSGQAQMSVEVRVSQDRLDGLEALMQLYVDAVTQVLDGNRGDWGDGVFYGGGYEITFSPVKHGGKNFLQNARIVFTADISSN